jgi:predicted outer membrane repeat protein
LKKEAICSIIYSSNCIYVICIGQGTQGGADTMKTKRITGLILAICLLISMTPLVATEAAETPRAGSVTNVYTNEDLQEALDAGGTARLGRDIEGGVTVTTVATLDLHGFVLRGGIDIPRNSGGSLTLIDSNPTSTHNNLTYTDPIDGETVYEVRGGAVTGKVTVLQGGSFYMEAGTLTGGSGIDIRNGTVVMFGGMIAGNVGYVNDFEEDDGTWAGAGPVCVVGKDGSFTMKGGIITCNSGRNYHYHRPGQPDRFEQLLRDGNDLGMTVSDNAVFTVENGVITRNVHCHGGAVCSRYGGTFNLIDGEISYNVAGGGGAIYMSRGNFEMSGGTIAYNKAIGDWGSGGALSGWSTVSWSVSLLDDNSAQVTLPTHNTIIITGGSITGNSADQDGGGLLVPAIYHFELSGNVSITDNTAGGDGGGICMPWCCLTLDLGQDEGTKIYYPGTIDIKDCTITGNTAGGHGGGIWLPYLEKTEPVYYSFDGHSGHTIYFPESSAKMSGRIIITDNTSGSDDAKIPDNLYLPGNTLITAVGDLTDSYIGVTTERTPTRTEPVVFTSGLSGNGAATNFFSDDPNYGVRLDEDGEALLGFFSYDITVEDSEHGSVSASVEGTSSLSGIEPGTLVTIETGADYMYELDELTVKKGARDVSVTSIGDGKYTFEMPAADVVISASFIIQSFEISFVNEDGTVLQSGKVPYGETPSYEGETPTKDADAQYTYTFAGWSPAITSVTGDQTYTATYSNTTNEYTIKFVNEDGTVLQSGKVPYGETPSYTGETPTKEADAQYTYAFAGWDSEITTVTGDKTYTATYSNKTNEYTIKFVNEDGTVLQSSKVPYGEMPSYTGETPVKEADAQYTYTFAGWSPEITSVTGDKTYTATYSSTVNQYTVKFVDYDGTTVLMEEALYDYGTPASEIAKPADPTREADAEYNYTFTGWTPEIADVTGNVVYTAVYSSGKQSYTVIWQQDDGAEIDRTTVEYGETPVHADPTKAADAQFTYTFSGWSPEISPVTGEATYKATYSTTVNEYTVTFKNEDGTVLQTLTVAYGEIPEYTGETPAKAEDADYTYAFAGWNQEISEVTGAAEYTATFAAVQKVPSPATDDKGLEVWVVFTFASFAFLGVVLLKNRKRAKTK